jgi:hypothetical protein
MVGVLPSQWKVVLGSVHPPVGTPHCGMYIVGRFFLIHVDKLTISQIAELELLGVTR